MKPFPPQTVNHHIFVNFLRVEIDRDLRLLSQLVIEHLAAAIVGDFRAINGSRTDPGNFRCPNGTGRQQENGEIFAFYGNIFDREWTRINAIFFRKVAAARLAITS
jgi:hypothetical protein